MDLDLSPPASAAASDHDEDDDNRLVIYEALRSEKTDINLPQSVNKKVPTAIQCQSVSTKPKNISTESESSPSPGLLSKNPPFLASTDVFGDVSDLSDDDSHTTEGSNSSANRLISEYRDQIKNCESSSIPSRRSSRIQKLAKAELKTNNNSIPAAETEPAKKPRTNSSSSPRNARSSTPADADYRSDYSDYLQALEHDFGGDSHYSESVASTSPSIIEEPISKSEKTEEHKNSKSEKTEEPKNSNSEKTDNQISKKDPPRSNSYFAIRSRQNREKFRTRQEKLQRQIDCDEWQRKQLKVQLRDLCTTVRTQAEEINRLRALMMHDQALAPFLMAGGNKHGSKLQAQLKDIVPVEGNQTGGDLTSSHNLTNKTNAADNGSNKTNPSINGSNKTNPFNNNPKAGVCLRLDGEAVSLEFCTRCINHCKTAKKFDPEAMAPRLKSLLHPDDKK